MTTETEETRALVPVVPKAPPVALLPTRGELEIILSIAQAALAAPGLLPAHIKKPETAVAIMLTGRELGVQPMTALRHIFVVNGRPETSTELKMGLVQAGDPTASFVIHETSAEVCDIELRRTGREPVRLRCTVDDVKKAGLASKQGPWQQYTPDMLRHFTMRRVCRLGAADLINALAPMTMGGVAAQIEHVRAIEGEVIERDLKDPALYNDGDDPASAPAVEGEVADVSAEIEPDAAARDAFEAWAAGKWSVGQLCASLDIPMKCGEPDCTDPIECHWLVPARALGLTDAESLPLAQDAAVSVGREYHRLVRNEGVPEGGALRQARAAIDPLGQLARAADEKRAKAGAAEAERVDEPDAPPAADGGGDERQAEP